MPRKLRTRSRPKPVGQARAAGSERCTRSAPHFLAHPTCEPEADDQGEILTLGVDPVQLAENDSQLAEHRDHDKEIRPPWEQEREAFQEQTVAILRERDDWREHAQGLERELRAQAEALNEDLAAHRAQAAATLQELAAHRAQADALLQERDVSSAHAAAVGVELAAHQDQAIALFGERDANRDHAATLLQDRDYWRERASSAEALVGRSLSSRVKRTVQNLVRRARS